MRPRGLGCEQACAGDAKAMYPTLRCRGRRSGSGPDPARGHRRLVRPLYAARRARSAGRIDPRHHRLRGICSAARRPSAPTSCSGSDGRVWRRAPPSPTRRLRLGRWRASAQISPLPRKEPSHVIRHEGTAVQTPSPRSPSGRHARLRRAMERVGVRGFHKLRLAARPPHPALSRRPLPASGERWRMRHRSAHMRLPCRRRER